MTWVDPTGPGAKAGLRVGERVLPAHGIEDIIDEAGPVGTVAVVHVIDGRRIRNVTVTIAAFSGALALEQRIDKIVSALTALGALSLAVVILLRGRDRRVAVRSANVLLLAGALGLSWGGALVCYNAFVAEALFHFAPTVLGSPSSGRPLRYSPFSRLRLLGCGVRSWRPAALLSRTRFNAFSLAGSQILFTHYGDILGAVSVAFLSLGIAYPILRHRLVDLNILISRATVFTIVSLILVAIFVTVEWSAGKVMEHALGVSSDRGDAASQAITLVLVIALGFSARSIHGFVDNGMMRAFFRKRLEGLTEIQNCASEIDVATDMRAVAGTAVSTVMRSLDVRGCAIYLQRDQNYVRAVAAGDAGFPERYGFNDVPSLKLRRWRHHIELNEGSSDLLFLPMLVRGDLLGFLVCGAKIDRTAFLADEIAALSLLAHHAGLAEATLDAPVTAGSERLTASLAAHNRIV